MGDQEYRRHPSVNLDSYPTNNNIHSSEAASDNNGDDRDGLGSVEKPDTLSVKISKSRDSESPTVQTPIVS